MRLSAIISLFDRRWCFTILWGVCKLWLCSSIVKEGFTRLAHSIKPDSIAPASCSSHHLKTSPIFLEYNQQYWETFSKKDYYSSFDTAPPPPHSYMPPPVTMLVSVMSPSTESSTPTKDAVNTILPPLSPGQSSSGKISSRTEFPSI